MSKLTLDESIKHCLEVAEQNEISAITYKNCKEIKTNMYEKLTAEKAENDCRECAADHRQLAAWLEDLKTASFLLGEAIDEMYKGTSCNPTYWLSKYGEAAGELVRRIDYARM